MADDVKVADQAWIAAALLHRESPRREDFTLEEIYQRALKEFGNEKHRGVWQHIVGHNIASNPPTPAVYRMLTKTARGRRRLFRAGDPAHPERSGKMVPAKEEIPAKYKPLLDWYQAKYNHPGASPGGQGSSGPAAYLAFVGLIPAYDLKAMEAIVERECERVEGEETGEGSDAA